MMIRYILTCIKTTPKLLRQDFPDVKNLLKIGKGNKPQEQEICFAKLLLDYNFKMLLKDEHPIAEPHFYYQPSGTQRSPDFKVFYNGKNYKFDLKSTKGKTFYWNDGWYENDNIYIINYVLKKSDQIYIGLGQYSYSEEENTAIIERRRIIKQLNALDKKVGNLRLYSRQANQYSCDRFTDEFSNKNFQDVIKFLE